MAHHGLAPYLLCIFQRPPVIDRVTNYHGIWVHMGIRLAGMGSEIIEIESICVITDANVEGEELVVLKGGGVPGFLGSLGETPVARAVVNLGWANFEGPMGKGKGVDENSLREKARFATLWIAEEEDDLGDWFVHWEYSTHLRLTQIFQYSHVIDLLRMVHGTCWIGWGFE